MRSIDDVGLHGEIARRRRTSARGCRKGAAGSSAPSRSRRWRPDPRPRAVAGIFISIGIEIRARDLAEGRHPARVDELADDETVETAPLDRDAGVHCSAALAVARRTSRAIPPRGSSARPHRRHRARGERDLGARRVDDAQHAAGFPSRGWPTEPMTASQRRCGRSGIATPATGRKVPGRTCRRGCRSRGGGRGRRT